jgi:hypothetical protein
MAPNPLISFDRDTELAAAARTRRFALPSPLARLALAAALAVSLASARAAEGQDDSSCLYAPPAPERLARVDSVADYRSTLQACHAADGRERIAIRAMSVGAEPLLLVADPGKLTTRIERAACWTCSDADEASLAATRMMRAIEESAAAPGLVHRGFLRNAGLVHGDAAGAFVTADLCPSLKPLERGFIEKLAAQGPHTPVALSISGLWLTHHFADYRWLVDQQASGALDILWVNHTYHHPYARGAPDERNFLLEPGVDADKEILEVERLLVANGQTPSLFFRFPGLISSAPLMQAVRRHHLISLGADAWLALDQRPSAGSIVLVHANGNEPLGVKLFERDLARDALSRPFEPLTAAPN